MKTAFFTGGTNGLGLVAATHLFQKGYRVYVTTRSEAGRRRLEAYQKQNAPEGDGEFVFLNCNLSDMRTVESAVNSFLKAESKLDLLVNNAGIWNTERLESAQGIEETWHVNVLAPVFLIRGLRPALLKSKKPKVITTASALHQGPIQFSDIEFMESFSGFKAYRQSKHSVLLFTQFFANTDSEIAYYCQHPGVVSTELARDMGFVPRLLFSIMGISKEKGAQNLIYLCQANRDQLHSGAYYAKKRVAKRPPEIKDQDYASKLMVKIDFYLRDKLEPVSL
jgi:NAD(P)-dependent dehydrogenase (short-subunit alcohol dehydrogenase family)